MTRPNHKSDPKADALHAMAQIRSELSAARERQRDADTELRRVNAALSQSIEKWKTAEDRFNSLVTIIPDIVYRIDPDGIFVYVNNAVELLGYRPEELIDRHFSEIILPSDCEQVSRRSVLKSIYHQSARRPVRRNSSTNGAPGNAGPPGWKSDWSPRQSDRSDTDVWSASASPRASSSRPKKWGH